MTCRVIPYEGSEPYIFVSYCHKDQGTLYPIFEQMARDGHRFWYDQANQAGDDWMDNIENHLEDCKVVVAFISSNSSLSHNCKSEIVYALKCKKKVVPILIDGSDLPKGLRMQLSHLHYLNAQEYASTDSLLRKLYESEEIKACNGTMQLESTPVSVPNHNVEIPVLFGGVPAKEYKTPGFWNTFVRVDPDIPSTGSDLTQKEPALVKEPVPCDPQPDPVISVNADTKTDQCSEPVVIQETSSQPAKTKGKIRVTVHRKGSAASKTSITTRKSTIVKDEVPIEHEAVEVPSETTQNKTTEVLDSAEITPAEPVISDPIAVTVDPAVEEISQSALVQDPVPVTAPVEPYEMTDVSKAALLEATVYMNDTPKSDARSTTGGDMTMHISNRNMLLLLHPATQHAYVLRMPQTKIGRSPIKSDIVIEGNDSISKYHADIIQVQNKIFLRDVNSVNGTFYNGQQMDADSQVQLTENPSIFQVSDETLVLFSGQLARQYINMKRVTLLLNDAGTGVRLMDIDDILLNRNNSWPDGTLADGKIHRAAHARIRLEQDGYHLINEAPARGNGTFLNDQRLGTDESRPLAPGDRIRLGDTSLTFVSITI